MDKIRKLKEKGFKGDVLAIQIVAHCEYVWLFDDFWML